MAYSPRERLQLAIAVLFGLMSGLGCMSLNLGNRTYESPGSYVDGSGVLKQRGDSPLIKPADGRIEIYYPRPFASTPHLAIVKGSESVAPNEVELLEQHPDHFVVRWKASGGEGLLSWKAEGMPGALPTSATPPATIQTSTTPPTPSGGK